MWFVVSSLKIEAGCFNLYLIIYEESNGVLFGICCVWFFVFLNLMISFSIKFSGVFRMVCNGPNVLSNSFRFFMSALLIAPIRGAVIM